MPKTTTVQIRIDEKTKRQAQAIFKKMGTSLSGGLNMFFAEVVRVKGMPFAIRTENGFISGVSTKKLEY